MSGVNAKRTPFGLGLAAAVSAYVCSRRRLRWHPTPTEDSGTLLFKPDLAPHPGHYTWRESLEILGQISPTRMITDPIHRKGFPGIFRFMFDRKYGAQIGAPAPDFDLPTTDGKRIRLSDFRGKNVALMFSAET